MKDRGSYSYSNKEVRNVKVLNLILIGILIGTAGMGAVVAHSADEVAISRGMEHAGLGISLQTADQIRDQEMGLDGDTVYDQTRDQDRNSLRNETRDQVQNHSCDQACDMVQRQNHLDNAIPAQEQIRAIFQEQVGEPVNQSADHPQLMNLYAYANTFAYTLQHRSEQLGDFGPQISRIMEGLNQSFQAEIQAQEALENRQVFMRTLFGGDETAAGQLEQETVHNQKSIQEMHQLIEQSSIGDPQIRAILQEQLQQMEQQQIQLQQLAQEERQGKGLIGWLWK
jgi:hypothetical protein